MNESRADEAEPRALALWRCIACGAMGRLADCTGQCAFRQIEVVEGQAYADLFEAREEAEATLAAGGPLLARLAATGADGAGLEAAYGALREEARALLRAHGVAASAEPTDDRPPVWLCETCGQVEAPQECLGVCVRPVRDFVVAGDYDALAQAAQAPVARARRLRALLAQLVQTRPRPGGWDRAAAHFAAEAHAVLN